MNAKQITVAALIVALAPLATLPQAGVARPYGGGGYSRPSGGYDFHNDTGGSHPQTYSHSSTGPEGTNRTTTATNTGNGYNRTTTANNGNYNRTSSGCASNNGKYNHSTNASNGYGPQHSTNGNYEHRQLQPPASGSNRRLLLHVAQRQRVQRFLQPTTNASNVYGYNYHGTYVDNGYSTTAHT